LANIGKVTPYSRVQNCLISLSDPGSCHRKSLAGKPHLLATFTSITTSPLSVARLTSLPSMSFIVKS